MIAAPAPVAVTNAHAKGLLSSRPRAALTAPATARAGDTPLGLAAGRDGVVFVSSRVRPARPAPLIVLLHGAGGTGRGVLRAARDAAEDAGAIVVAPDSRELTWDLIATGLGPDIAFIDRALERLFAMFAIDPARVAIAGFSDGASYALSVGLANGALFTHVIAFSPGFARAPSMQGAPRIFVSHGTRDAVLPIGACSRPLVQRLKKAAYDVDYREFDGPHAVPPEIAREALQWFATRARGPAGSPSPAR